MSGDDDLPMIVGEIRGSLKALVATIDRERQERDAEERTADLDRQEIRDHLGRLSSAVGPMVKRLDAIDRTDVETSLVSRIGKVEVVADDFKRKQAAAVFILTGALSIIGYGLHTFAGDIKALVLRLLRVG